ncbi:synaptonemal complex protein 2-like isoform X2 [Syngnathoides biaculeatus]|uniref:synaptonemal complex protein 2-like isoform X2 n=1 Tax=Syngnathoides biaculeatus TaxID=300417 RepID=UPI002ADE8DB0|nr:synaptonemal complex protein 2-like isoform X2 [Syngnathoides biaculeatus]
MRSKLKQSKGRSKVKFDWTCGTVRQMEMEMEACLSSGDSTRLAELLREEGVTGSTLVRLGLVVRKQLRLAEFGRVDVIFKSLESLMGDKNHAKTLLGLGITHKVLSWFQTLRDLLTCGSTRSSTQFLVTESFFDFLLLLSGSRLPAVELSVVLLELLHTFLEAELHFNTRLEAVRTFNSILDSLGKDQRRRIQSESRLLQMMSEVVATIQTVGDYEMQVSLSEALCRLTPRKERVQRANQWFCCDLGNAFCDIKDADFEVDCRHFLNFLNDCHGDQRKVWSVPCVRAFLETTELFRPKDEKLDEFWVDFNFGSQCVSFFIDLPQGFLWGSVHLLKEEVDRYQLEVQQDERSGAQAVLSVQLKIPIVHLSSKGHRVKLLFRPELLGELEAAAARVFTGEGDNKGAGDEVQASPSTTRPLGTVYRKKPHSQLKVLPLSSPSSDDANASVTTTSRSRAEILFDQVVHSTPVNASGPRAWTEFDIFQEEKIVTGGNVSGLTKECSGSKRKRAPPQLGSPICARELEVEPEEMQDPVRPGPSRPGSLNLDLGRVLTEAMLQNQQDTKEQLKIIANTLQHINESLALIAAACATKMCNKQNVE